MRVVVDANIVIAALFRPDGWTALQLRRTDVEFFVPAAIASALAKHGGALAERASCGPDEWGRRVGDLFRRIAVVPNAVAEPHLGSPLTRAVERVDAEDAIYVASMVGVAAQFLWTYDAAILRLLPGRAVAVVP